MKTYDVFISYAIEDKFPTASGLAERLKKAGLNVYFVGDRLTAGDLISTTVYHGLEQSEFCVLIISPHYVRNWPAIERNHILHREKKEGRKLVFPVWNNISRDDVARHFPELIDHYAPSVEAGLDAVADHLQRAIHKRKREQVKRSPAGKFFALAAVLILLLFGLYTFLNNQRSSPPMRNTYPLAPDN